MIVVAQYQFCKALFYTLRTGALHAQSLFQIVFVAFQVTLKGRYLIHRFRTSIFHSVRLQNTRCLADFHKYQRQNLKNWSYRFFKTKILIFQKVKETNYKTGVTDFMIEKDWN